LKITQMFVSERFWIASSTVSAIEVDGEAAAIAQR
jgi:hypothetical protein